METLDKYRSYLLIGLAVVALLLLAAFTDRDQSTTSERKNVDAASDERSTQKPASSNTKQPTYNYLAQTGDSYSKIARKAVQTYGIVNNLKLSLAQIIAAETSLTTKAGSPELNEGQVVSFDPSQVKLAIEAARKLSTADLDSWQAYVADVDFNTNAVGQS